MKHEDYEIRFNEIVFDQRDVIQNFLDATADIRYGNQMFEWAVNVQVIAANGAIYRCVEVYRDKDVVVGFIVKDAEGNRYMWEAHNFA